MTLAQIFPPLMILTFVAALVTLVLGVSGMTGSADAGGNRSTRLMSLRVALCALLLLQIVLYIAFIR